MLIRDYMDKVSRYRSHILGFCILAVIVYHANLSSNSGPLGYLYNPIWEMELFFFITGMGVYRSLSKDDNSLSFYKRRIKRIYPRYLPIIVVYFLPIFLMYTGRENLFTRIQEFLGNALFTGWLAGLDNQFNWYMQALMIFYLAAPYLYLLIKGYEGSGRKLCVLLGFFVVGQLGFIGTRFLIAVSRSISFVLGIAAADWAARGKSFRLSIPVLLALFVLGHGINYYTMAMPLDLSMHYGLCWYPALLVLPGSLYLLCLFFAFCEKLKGLGWLNGFFALMGRYSLEGYLVNLLAYDLRSRLQIEFDSNLMWFALIIAICPLSILYGKLMDKLQK